ncbi:DUF5667 domain-containing protein [Pseudonocardia bannensis]|uniref:DUF5667 domain-containing protein n=1 Tax=Pseudonocardia bannensis TaxID=630973 RepID=A0A848DL70_9PSEU|nr:DUF5667 domain-containing protein [Pseudonocardia bannensis]NMH93438.1 hypothetical protein [Pseudonocardia bannensis]
MPAGQGKDEERFAAAAEFGLPPGADAREEFAHEVALAAALDRSRTSLSPDPEASARMKQRLFAALAEQAQESPPEPSPAEQTAPLARPLPGAPGPVAASDEPPGAGEITTEIAAVPGTEPVTDHAPATGSGHVVPRSRRARHKMPSGVGERPRDNRASRRPGAPSRSRRIALVSAAALVVMVALAGTGVFVSRDALPGDALYAMKRVSESAGLAMTFGDEAKARRHLELAATRLSEVEQLIARQQTSGPDPQLLESAISEFDAATSEGSRMLLAGRQEAGAASLGDLRTWAAEQSARLAALRAVLPLPMLAEADQSIALLDRLVSRTEALHVRLACTEVTSGVVDDLGPVPAEGVCAPRTEGSDPATSGGSDSSRAGDSTTQTNGNSTAPSAPGGSTAPGTTDENEGGLLPGLDPEDNPLGDAPSDSGGGSTRSSTEPDPQVSVPVPLPLLPPITLPPLLPGQPAITIG